MPRSERFRLGGQARRARLILNDPALLPWGIPGGVTGICAVSHVVAARRPGGEDDSAFSTASRASLNASLRSALAFFWRSEPKTQSGSMRSNSLAISSPHAGGRPAEVRGALPLASPSRLRQPRLAMTPADRNDAALAPSPFGAERIVSAEGVFPRARRARDVGNRSPWQEIIRRAIPREQFVPPEFVRNAPGRRRPRKPLYDARLTTCRATSARVDDAPASSDGDIVRSSHAGRAWGCTANVRRVCAVNLGSLVCGVGCFSPPYHFPAKLASGQRCPWLRAPGPAAPASHLLFRWPRQPHALRARPPHLSHPTPVFLRRRRGALPRPITDRARAVGSRKTKKNASPHDDRSRSLN